MGKTIGKYLVEAGLLEQSQVDLALAEQQRTGQRLGDIIVAHGWLKRQTVEYWMKNVIIPHRRLTTPPQSAASPNQLRPRKPPEETLVIGWEQTSVPPQTPPSQPPQPKDIHYRGTLILKRKDLPPLG